MTTTKGEILHIRTYDDDLSMKRKWMVEIEFDEIPTFHLGKCEVKQ